MDSYAAGGFVHRQEDGRNGRNVRDFAEPERGCELFLPPLTPESRARAIAVLTAELPPNPEEV